MHTERRRPSSPMALCCGAASALISGCYTIVPIAQGDAAPPDSAMVPVDTPVVADVIPMEAAAPPDVVRDGNPADVPVMPSGAGSVDLLLVVDNSNSMTHGQDYLNAYVNNVVSPLFARYGVRDVHVGVVDTDLGTPGSTVPSCANSDIGDDGLLNPRARGPAILSRMLPPADALPFCTPEVVASPFITLRSTDDPMAIYHLPTCHSQIGLGGCGLEQQLESAYRALTRQSAAGAPNAGFLRSEATLAVLVLSDEEDGSVRDCRYHDGVGACSDAVDVFNIASSRWSSPDLNLRFYGAAPGGAQDPTWALERYVDPARPTRGFLGLKPGHPERVVFGAITGVPLDVPRRMDGSTDWDTLLGPPAAGRPDDFAARNGQRAYANPMDSSGPTSMRANDPDPLCSTRMVPACRLRGSAPSMACDLSSQYYAWRSRRIAEVARRFDESALCAGGPCRNGMVASICETGDSAPFARFADMIGRRVTR